MCELLIDKSKASNKLETALHKCKENKKLKIHKDIFPKLWFPSRKFLLLKNYFRKSNENMKNKIRLIIKSLRLRVLFLNEISSETDQPDTSINKT